LQERNGLQENGSLHEGHEVMPLTSKGRKVMRELKDEYGSKRGEGVFYAMVNSGQLTGVEEKRKRKTKRSA
jgi:hypothetical protein